MSRWLLPLIIISVIIIAGLHIGGNSRVIPKERVSVNEKLTLTTEQDFENGTMENLDSTSSPGDLILQSYTSHYTMGQLDNPDPDYYWTGGYTILPGDSDFEVPEDGTITSITLNVGDYNAPLKFKVLRNSGTNIFYAVATSQEFYPNSNQESTYSVSLPVKAGDRIGIYTDGSLSALSFNGNTGYWWTDGEVQSDPVTMNWDSSDNLIVTMQATVTTQKYLHYGNWTSNTLQLKSIPTDASISWNADLPSGTSITMHVRTSSDGYTWNPWETVTNGESISNPQMYIQLWAEFSGKDYDSPVLHDITINYDYNVNGLVINEISSYGSGNSEWVEIYNSGPDSDITGLTIDDQDGNTYTVPNDIGTMPHGTYLVIYFGSGTNDEDFSDGVAHLYANFGVNVLNDVGDDIVLKIGDSPIDYVGFWSSSGGIGDVDPPPSGLNFVKNGVGYYGYAPAPGNGESISLIPNAQDKDEASDWYITNSSSSTPGSENVNLLKVDGYDISPTSARQYDTVPIMKLNFESIGTGGEYIVINQINIKLGGTAVDSDISALYLYSDDDHSGNYSSGDSLQAQTTFTSNNATFSTSIGLQCGSIYTYFLVVKFSKNADTSHYANFTLENTKVSGSDLVIGQPITTRNINIEPIDSVPPYVNSVVLNPHSPVGEGTVNIHIYFSEDMNQSSPLNVTYGPTGYEYNVSGSWVGATEWSGSIYISSTAQNGNMKLEISDGKDLAGNVMNPNPYEYDFVIDTQKPYVTKISYNPSPPFGIGNYQITIDFSEDMNQSVNPTVKFGISQINFVNGGWNTATTWIGTIVINNYTENGENVLTVSDAVDLAGNSMITNTTTFLVDTQPPNVKSIEFSKSPPLGVGAYSLTLHFSESMNTTKNPTVTFGITSTYFVMGTWLNDTTWIGNFEIRDTNDNGENLLTVKDAEDSCGNTMIVYHYSFMVDTKKPQVLSIDFNEKPLFKVGQYTVKITFTEDMNTSAPLNVSYGITGRRYISGKWVSSREWNGEIKITNSSENGKNKIYISGGKDIAGNVMNINSNGSFVVDTIKPTVEISFNPQSPYGNNSEFTADLLFSEGVTNVSAMVGGISLVPIKIQDNEYSVTISTSSLSDGNYTLIVYGATDYAGNVMNQEISQSFIIDKKPPRLSIGFQGNPVEGNSIVVVADVSDTLTGVQSVTLKYTLPDGETREVAMANVNGRYVAKIYNVPMGKIRVEVIATDGAGNEATMSDYIEIHSYLSTIWWLILIIVVAVLITIILIVKKLKKKIKESGGILKKKPKEGEEFYED